MCLRPYVPNASFNILALLSGSDTEQDRGSFCLLRVRASVTVKRTSHPVDAKTQNEV